MTDGALVKSALSRDLNDNHVHVKKGNDDAEIGETGKYRQVQLVVPEPRRPSPPTQPLGVEDIGGVSGTLKVKPDMDTHKLNPGISYAFPQPHLPWQFPFFPSTQGYPFFQYPGLHGYGVPFLPDQFRLRQTPMEYIDRLHGNIGMYPPLFFGTSKRFDTNSPPYKTTEADDGQKKYSEQDLDIENPSPKDLSQGRSPTLFMDTTAAVSEKRRGRKESEPSKYQCSGCEKSYSTFSGLSKHKQFHCILDNKKEFTCKYCEKCYVSLGALKMHIRTHTLPCKCKICGKAFSRPWLLQGHVRTHTGEKPFTCVHCLRAFADRSNLRAHLQTHSDVKKYSCKTCSKTFSRMSLLLKHEESCSRVDI